jgi:fucose 4-O-acetylase-like acetyltransferase
MGNKPTGVYMHFIYGFHVPAFVLISGYIAPAEA